MTTLYDYFYKNDIPLYKNLAWFGLVWFYAISTIVGYLMLNPVFTYTSNT